MDQPDDPAEKDDSGSYRIKTVESEGYDIHPASAADGGLQLSGQFIIDFYSHLDAEPDTETWAVENGEIGELLEYSGMEYDGIRRKETAVAMTQQNAFGVATFIISELLGEEVTQNDVRDAIIESFEDHIEVN